MSKIDFDNKLISFCRNVTSNKTKSFEVLKKLDSLTTKVYIFSWPECILQVMMDLKTRLFIKQHLIKLGLKKEEGTDYVGSWKSKG